MSAEKKEKLLKSILGREEVELMEEQEVLPKIFKEDREELKERAEYLSKASEKMKLNTEERLSLLATLKAWTLDFLKLKSLFRAYNHSRNKKRGNFDLLIQSFEQESPAAKYYKDT